MAKRDLIVVTVPALNEEKTLPPLLSAIHAVMRKERYHYLIQVVDDGSTDRTAEVAKASGANVISHPKNLGLARTFGTEMAGALNLGAKIIVHIDADGQYLPEEIPKLITEVRRGSDLVLGSRFLGTIESMRFINRHGNKAFSAVISSILRQRITDAQTGFRAFTDTVARTIPITSGYTYTHEQLIRSERAKLKISEVPITARKTRASRLMKSPLDYALKAGINIVRLYRDYEPLKFFLSAAFLFFIPGLLIGMFLVGVYLQRGVVGHLPLTILSVLLMLTGLQIAIFGLLADMLRK